jgi:NADH:ubiquinone oxidoreductase subunit 3 (subunit A)
MGTTARRRPTSSPGEHRREHHMDQTGLIYVIGFGFAATTFVYGTILFSWLITHRRQRPQKGLPYESGIDTIGDTWSRFGLAFYLYALLFVAFDVEIIFVYLWAVAVRRLSGEGIVLIGVFLAILMFGELYAWKKGDLQWQ